MAVAPNAEDLIAALDRLFVEQFELEPAAVHPAALLREDLDLDSLDAADMLVLIEKRFNIRMDDEVARTFRTVGDVHEHVRARMTTTTHATPASSGPIVDASA